MTAAANRSAEKLKKKGHGLVANHTMSATNPMVAMWIIITIVKGLGPGSDGDCLKVGIQILSSVYYSYWHTRGVHQQKIDILRYLRQLEAPGRRRYR